MPTHVPKSEDQKDAEADVERFRRELGPFVVAAETTRMAMVFTDAGSPGNPIVFANDSFLTLTGYDREEVLGQSFDFLIEKGADSVDAARITTMFSDNTSAATEILYHRKLGAPVWVAVFITPVRDDAGEVVQHFASLFDLSTHKADEARSRMMIDELNHRVKNTLATVRSIVSQGLRSSKDIEVIRDSIESRLFALSRSHDLLARENWRSAGLFDLVKEALEPFGSHVRGADRLVISGKNIQLRPATALAIGIALHELATNAVKYGALSNTTGSVLISWAIEPSSDGDRLRLQWRETGGPEVAQPAHKGFGSRVLERGLAHELNATVRLDFPKTGAVCTVDIPAPKEISDDLAES